MTLAALALVFPAMAPPVVRLAPLDNRPASLQYPQMIGAIAGVEVQTPPESVLGRFERPGNPDHVLVWLEAESRAALTPTIVSADMIAYGGLVASRTSATSEERAIERVRRLAGIRKESDAAPLYVFSAITRLAPTAVVANAKWRDTLVRYVRLREEQRAVPTKDGPARLEHLRKSLPVGVLEDYDKVRRRNLAIQKELIRLVERGVIDYLLLGQDDAAETGPHIRERAELQQLAARLNVSGKVLICEGIDQHASALVSKAVMRQVGFVPKVEIVFSDESKADRAAKFETKSMRESFREQLIACGARQARPDETPDYRLFVNVPEPLPTERAKFMAKLSDALANGDPVALADVNIDSRGMADAVLFDFLRSRKQIPFLKTYGAWNTAGNTFGAAVPAANFVAWNRAAERTGIELERARLEFLLNRIVNDYGYHRWSRPLAYMLVDDSPTAAREEVYGEELMVVSEVVRRDLSRRIIQLFDDQFRGLRVRVVDQEFDVVAIEDPQVRLPWPRAYEVLVEFRLVLQPVPTRRGGGG
ncbi:MAG: DUF4127 family protein [Fimbriimonadaceae bacterium]